MIKCKGKSCLVFITQRLDGDMKKYLQYLKCEMEGVMDFWLLYDSSLGNYKEDEMLGISCYQYPFHTLDNFFHQGNPLLHNPLLALLKFIESHEYDNYLLMENDIVLNGSFAELARKLTFEEKVDYVHIATDILGGSHAHWPIKLIKDNPFPMLYFAWSQLVYASKRFLEAVRDFIQVNNTFFYEFLLPTIAYNKGFRVRQFENYGYRFCLSWGPAEEFENAYLYDRQPNTFYHPIKNLGIVDIDNRMI